LFSAFVELNVQVDNPLLFVELQAPLLFVVPVSVAVNSGMIPLTPFPKASNRFIVIVEVELPSATEFVPSIVEVEELTDAAMVV